MRRLAVLAILCAACSRSPTQAPQPVSLPDVSILVQPTAREQLRSAYATLDAKIKTSRTPPADLADSYGEMGRLLMAAEFTVAAEPYFLNAEALASDDMRWPYYLGHVYRARGDLSRSAAAFERALRLAPSDEASLVWLGDAYLGQDRTSEAKEVLNRALSANPRAVAALYHLGRAALLERDYAHAAEYFERALTIDPHVSILHYPLAMAYRGLGQAENAEAQLRQRGDVDVGPVDPLMRQLEAMLDTAPVFEKRAIEASRTGDWKSAAAYLQKAVALEPNDVSLHHKLGTALSMSGDATGAVGELEAAVRGAPDNVDARFNLGQVLVSTGRRDEAVVQFLEVVKRAPKELDARFELAEALRISRRPQEALAYYEFILAADRHRADARFGYAMALVGAGRVEAARGQLKEGQTLHPDRPEFGQALARLESAGNPRR
jgi:tetratricopeptide (TPR) repeat protein